MPDYCDTRSASVDSASAWIAWSGTDSTTESTTTWSVWTGGTGNNAHAGLSEAELARQKAERELRTSFDVRRFHDAVLGSGPMPLAILERHIDWYIAGEKARESASAGGR